VDATGTREGGLLGWQWSIYPDGHRDRKNLAVHAATVPLFLAGTCLVAAAPVAGPGLAIAGLAAMATSVLLQGRGHAREAVRPVPFLGPTDVVARLFVEQWVTFPRFVLSGGFARAWRGAARPPT
jgi:hypothetical protein